MELENQTNLRRSIKMLFAEVLRPYTKKVEDKILVCKTCNISYSRKDYKILYDNKKIAYFNFYMNKKRKPLLLCHHCFTKVLMRICKDNEMPEISVLCRDVRTDFIMKVPFNPNINLGFDDLLG